MGVSLPDLSFLEGAPEQNYTPRLSPHISSALLVLLGEGGEGPALLSLQQNLPMSFLQRGGSVCENPTADSVLERVHASPCHFTIGAEFSSMPPFENPGLLGGTRHVYGHSFPAPRLWGPSPLWDCPVCLSLPLCPSWYLLPLLPSSLCGSLTCPELTSQ